MVAIGINIPLGPRERGKGSGEWVAEGNVPDIMDRDGDYSCHGHRKMSHRVGSTFFPICPHRDRESSPYGHIVLEIRHRAARHQWSVSGPLALLPVLGLFF